MTSRRIWIVAWALVALWTLAALAGYGVVDLLGGVAVERADVAARDPEHVAWIVWFFDLVRDLGLAAIVFAWAVVTAVILGIGALLAKITRDRADIRDAGPSGGRR